MMFKFESTVGKADTEGKSARVIIPKQIREMLKLDFGDKIIWKADISDNEVKITVEKK